MTKNIAVNTNGRSSYWNNKILILLNDHEDNRDNSYENNVNKKI